MNKNTIKLGAATAILLMTTGANAGYALKKKQGAQDTKLILFGFSQLEARTGDGIIKDDQDASVKFGAQRIRIGLKYITGPVRGKLFLDFNKDHGDKSGVGLPDMIKDAFVTYYANNALAVKVGLIKMPHGMGFTIPGWNLDVVERGFDKQLAMERNIGIMLSGRAIGDHPNCDKKHKKVNGFEMGHERPWIGFGYDLMIANQAGRSGSVINAKAGNANSYVGRIMYDWGQELHVEASYALSEQAGGLDEADREDYSSFNFGVDSHFGRSNAKLEVYMSENIRGVDGWDISTVALTGTHYVTDTLELAGKHIQGQSEKGGVETDLGNTYLGFNYYLAPFDNKMSRGAKRKRNAHRMQFNYVVASGDTDGTTTWNGLKGYKEDAILLQYQYKY